MRRGWLALVLAAATIAPASIARADEVGCCEVECHSSDGAGRGMHSMQRREMTQTQCESAFPECEVEWRPEACGAVGGSMGVVREPDEEEQ